MATRAMMEPLIASTGALGKARAVVQGFRPVWMGSILDVGCRSRELEAALLDAEVTYVGLDINGPADIIADLGKGIPLPDDEFDLVVALDVLEHTDDLHFAFQELCRVAREGVLVSLPNAYEIRTRLRHLRGQPISGKYGLPLEKPVDRHRWFFSLDEARHFLHEQASLAHWTVDQERFLAGPRLRRILPIARRWPNLFAATYVSLLRPVEQTEH